MADRLRIATDDLPEKDRIPFMRDFYGRFIMGLDLDPLPEADLDMEMHALQLERAGISYGSISPLTAERSNAMTSDGNDRIVIASYAAPFWSTGSRGQDFVVSPGDALVMPLDRPVRWVFTERSIATSVFVEPEAVRARLPRFDPEGPMAFAAGMPGLDLLFSHARSVMQSRSVGPSIAEVTARQLIDLASFALGNVRHPDEVGATESVRAARFRAARADVDGLFRQPDLSIRALAAKHGISVRYLQLLFEENGATFSQYLQSVRLDHAFRRLQDAPPFMKVRDIAAEAGFADMSTFNRLFRQRYGETPVAVRSSRAERVP